MKRSLGYSLVELLVVVTLLSLLALAATSLFYSSIKGGSKASVLAEVKQQGDYATATIERAVRNGVRITECDSNLLTVELSDNTLLSVGTVSDETTTQLVLNGVALTSHDLEVTEIQITCVDGKRRQPDGVVVQFTLQKGTEAVDRAEEVFKQSFQTTVSLRNY